MTSDTKKVPTYIQTALHFYFAPELRSIFTLPYLALFGYFSLYYLDSALLALRYIAYTVLGHTALLGITHLFVGVVFVLSLTLPFFISLYSIFVLPRVWKMHDWAHYIQWGVTIGIFIGGILIMICSDKVARTVANFPQLESFIEDTNLSGRI